MKLSDEILFKDHLQQFSSKTSNVFQLLFRVSKVDNNTYEATLVRDNRTSGGGDDGGSAYDPHDDPEGALYYVVVVLAVYALAIVMFIGSFVKKSDQDIGLSTYMRDLEKVKSTEKRQEKFRFRVQMLTKDRKHRILGENRSLFEMDFAKGDHRKKNKKGKGMLMRPSSDSDLSCQQHSHQQELYREEGSSLFSGGATGTNGARDSFSSWSLISLDNEDSSTGGGLLTDSRCPSLQRLPSGSEFAPSGPVTLQPLSPRSPSPLSLSFAPIPEVTIETYE